MRGVSRTESPVLGSFKGMASSFRTAYDSRCFSKVYYKKRFLSPLPVQLSFFPEAVYNERNMSSAAQSAGERRSRDAAPSAVYEKIAAVAAQKHARRPLSSLWDFAALVCKPRGNEQLSAEHTGCPQGRDAGEKRHTCDQVDAHGVFEESGQERQQSQYGNRGHCPKSPRPCYRGRPELPHHCRQFSPHGGALPCGARGGARFSRRKRHKLQCGQVLYDTDHADLQ